MSKPIGKRSPGRRFLVIAGAIAVGLGVGLSGCAEGNGSPGAAAYVNGAEISEHDVTVAVQDWYELTGEQVPRADMAISLAQADVILPVGEEAGLVDEADVAEIVDAFAQNVEGERDFHLSTPTTRLISYFVVMQNMQSVTDQSVFEEALSAMENADLKLNPRYGSIEDGSYVPSGPIGDGFTSDPVLDIFG